MGKEKSTTLSRKKKLESKSIVFPPKEEVIKSKLPKKVPGMNKKRKINEGFNNVNSLKNFKEMTERKKLNEIDEKIKFLKTDINSLLRDGKSNKNYDSFADSKNNLINNDYEKFDQTNVKPVESDIKETFEIHKYPKSVQINNIKNFKPSCSSTPSKFSEWLSKTIDEINLKLPTTKESHNVNNVLFNSKLNVKSNKNLSITTDFNSSNFYECSVSQQKIEQMLYKSLVLKSLNSEIYLSSSEDDVSENIKFAEVLQHQKCDRFKKLSKSPNRQKLISKSKKKPKSFQSKTKRRRLISLNSSCSDVEIINRDNYCSNEVTKIKTILSETSTICLDSDVSHYDWSEPFDLNLDTDAASHSNVEVTGANVYNQKLESDCADLIETISYDEIGKGQPKRTWECPVCFEPSKGQDIVATQCGHVFCKKCLEFHFSKLGESCPSCRNNLTDKPVITLFNF